jgi:hypothetical protein
MNRQQYYSVLLPAAGIIYVIAMFLLDWDSTAVVVGALILGLVAILGRLIPLAPGVQPRERNRN